MKKLNKVAMLFASAVLAAPMAASAAAHAMGAPSNQDNWKNGDGSLIWKNGTNEYCWRDAFWTPATANAACDGALKPPPPPPPPALGQAGAAASSRAADRKIPFISRGPL